MNEKMLNEEFERAKKMDNFLPFFEDVKPYLQKIEEIEVPYIFLSKGHKCIEVEFEKMLNDKESNYVSIDFYENNVEIYMSKYRKGKISEYPTDVVVFEYNDKMIEFISTVCKEFLDDFSNQIYEVKNEENN